MLAPQAGLPDALAGLGVVGAHLEAVADVEPVGVGSDGQLTIGPVEAAHQFGRFESGGKTSLAVLPC